MDLDLNHIKQEMASISAGKVVDPELTNLLARQAGLALRMGELTEEHRVAQQRCEDAETKVEDLLVTGQSATTGETALARAKEARDGVAARLRLITGAHEKIVGEVATRQRAQAQHYEELLAPLFCAVIAGIEERLTGIEEREGILEQLHFVAQGKTGVSGRLSQGYSFLPPGLLASWCERARRGRLLPTRPAQVS